MMPWLLALQSLLTLALTVACVRYARRAATDNASVWRALAELRMDHNSLATASAQTFEDVGNAMAEMGETIADLDAAQCQPIWPAPQCQCKSCRESRAFGAS